MASDRDYFEVYKLYLKMKNYFNIPDYSFEMASKVNPSAFNKRKDRYFFFKLYEKFPKKEKCQEYLISVFLFDRTLWIGNIFDNSALDRYHYARLKNVNSIERTFRLDIEKIKNYLETTETTFLKLLKCDQGYSVLIAKNKIIGISLETLTLLNILFNFTRFSKAGDLLYDDLVFKIYKYKIFMKPLLNNEMKNVVQELLEEFK